MNLLSRRTSPSQQLHPDTDSVSGWFFNPILEFS